IPGVVTSWDGHTHVDIKIAPDFLAHDAYGSERVIAHTAHTRLFFASEGEDMSTARAGCIAPNTERFSVRHDDSSGACVPNHFCFCGTNSIAGAKSFEVRGGDGR